MPSVKLHSYQMQAMHECPWINHLDGLGNNNVLQQNTFKECLPANLLEPLTKCRICWLQATTECHIINHIYLWWDNNSLQWFAGHECKLPNLFKPNRELNSHQLSASSEFPFLKLPWQMGESRCQAVMCIRQMPFPQSSWVPHQVAHWLTVSN